MNAEDLKYRDITLDAGKIDVAFYYDSKKHRFDLSINYGEKYLNVTRKEALAIFKFLKVLEEISRNSKKASTEDHNRKSVRGSSGEEEFEDVFDFQDPVDEEDFDFQEDEENFDFQEDEEIFDTGPTSKESSIPKVDKTDIEWDTFEKDQLANEPDPGRGIR